MNGAMGTPDLTSNEWFADHETRCANQKLLDSLFCQWTEQHRCEELESPCEANGAPYSRLYTARDMLSDPHYAARNAIVDVEHPEIGALKMPMCFRNYRKLPAISDGSLTNSDRILILYWRIGLHLKNSNHHPRLKSRTCLGLGTEMAQTCVKSDQPKKICPEKQINA